MANEEHVALLKQGVEAWNTWRSENLNIRPDLGKADLREAKLGKAPLEYPFGVNLVQANLSGADLRGADLSEADLVQAELFDADLSGANLSKANLTGAFLAYARLIGANLNGAQLDGALLIQANLSGADLRGLASRLWPWWTLTLQALTLPAVTSMAYRRGV